MPCSESTQGKKSERKFIKKLTKKGMFVKVKVFRKETPTSERNAEVCWSKNKRPGYKRY